MEISSILEQTPLSEMLAFSLSYLAATILLICFLYKPHHLYLLDFKCCHPPHNLRVPLSSLFEHLEISGCWDREAIDFQKRLIQRSGISNETYLPDGMHHLPADKSLSATMQELETVLFPIIDDLLKEQSVDPRSIDIVITNCSLFTPTPSLASLVINRFGIRSNVKSFNLSGMGCSAGILSLNLAKDILKVHKNSLALVLSTEAVSPNFYEGNVKSMLLANCLFRMGGAAVLLSNRACDRGVKEKYELMHIVRTHLGSKNGAYKCVIQEPDDEGKTGVCLSRSIVQVAGDALKRNMGELGKLVLPYSEQIKYGVSLVWKRVWGPARKRGSYIPNFRKAFQHFCIHAGGRAVIEGMKDRLKLTERDIEASRMTLYRFGNMSSSTTWYSLAYIERKGRVRRGDKVWQLAFGSGFKCNSAVWKCVSEPRIQDSNVWSDQIHTYPLQVPELIYY
ncbi:hypothetical protein ACS0TY_002240 [Phlomoides rotata]